ncbi:hypothetical protein CCP3SC5AM1_2210003 [Gammaproteobacteria bacterium]
MSAYAAQARLVLAKQAVDGKSNEITAIPLLLDMLDLHGWEACNIARLP